MRIRPEKKSDAEFIEDVRKRLKQPNSWAVFQYGMAAVFLICFFAYIAIIKNIYGFLEDPDLDLMTTGFFIGTIIGFIPAFCIAMAALSIYWATEEYRNRRADRLLIRLYDRLSESDCQQDGAGNPDKRPGFSKNL